MNMDEIRLTPGADPIAPFTECEVLIARRVGGTPEHREVCSELSFDPYPPSSGPHFSQWAAFGAYDAPVPFGFLVHSMEHGAVVLVHNCDGAACDEVQAEVTALIADHGDDPACRGEPYPARFVVTPDPALPYAVAALAWEHVYLATCLDPPSLREFVEAHYAQAPEDFCFPGVDLSASGWCTPAP